MRRFALAHAIALVVSCSDAAPNASLRSDADRAVARYSLRSGITLTGSVTRLPDAIEVGGTAPLADVEVCEDKSGTCMVTGRDGWFALEGLTPETEILLVFNKAGYYPTIQAMESPRWSTTTQTAALADLDYQRDAFNAQLRAAGLPEMDEGLAVISFRVATENGALLTPGVQVTLDPSSGTGPFYVYSDNSSSLEPPSNTAAVFGIFVNVEPREEGYELVYSYASGECMRYAHTVGGWPPRSGRVNAIRVPVRGGYASYPYSAYCWPVRDRPPAEHE